MFYVFKYGMNKETVPNIGECKYGGYNLIFLNCLYTKINENCGVAMFLVDGDFSLRKNNEENLWVYLMKISGESFIIILIAWWNIY